MLGNTTAEDCRRYISSYVPPSCEVAILRIILILLLNIWFHGIRLIIHILGIKKKLQNVCV